MSTPNSEDIELAVQTTVMKALQPWATKLADINPTNCDRAVHRISIQVAIATLAPTAADRVEALRALSDTSRQLYSRLSVLYGDSMRRGHEDVLHYGRAKFIVCGMATTALELEQIILETTQAMRVSTDGTVVLKVSTSDTSPQNLDNLDGLNDRWSSLVTLGRRFSPSTETDSAEVFDGPLSQIADLCRSVRKAADYLSTHREGGSNVRLIAIPIFSQMGADASSLVDLLGNSVLPLSAADREYWTTISEEVASKAPHMVKDLLLEKFVANLRLVMRERQAENAQTN